MKVGDYVWFERLKKAPESQSVWPVHILKIILPVETSRGTDGEEYKMMCGFEASDRIDHEIPMRSSSELPSESIPRCPTCFGRKE